MINNSLSDDEKNRVSNLLYPDIENMCEEYIKHVNEVGGFNRFNIKSVLLQSAWQGYLMALKENNLLDQ
jgi:hypothetical protein